MKKFLRCTLFAASILACATLSSCDDSADLSNTIVDGIMSYDISSTDEGSYEYSLVIDCKGLSSVIIPSDYNGDSISSVEIINGDKLGEIEFSGKVKRLIGLNDCSYVQNLDLSNIEEVEMKALADCKSLRKLVLNTIRIVDTKGYDESGYSSYFPHLFCDDTKSAIINSNSYEIVPQSLSYVTIINGEIADYAFVSKNDIDHITLGPGVDNIGNHAFDGCKRLYDFKAMPKSIGEKAFYKCSYLHKADLGDRLETLGKAAFMGCSELESIKTPSSLKRLEAFVFSGCSNLKDINLEYGLEYLNLWAFNDVNIRYLLIPSSVKSITKSTSTSIYAIVYDGDARGFADIDYNATDSIGNEISFPIELGSKQYCKLALYKKDYVTINNSIYGEIYDHNIDGVRTIKEEAYYKNSSIERIVISSDVKEIKKNAFAKCTNLEKVIICSSDIKIDKEAFAGCHNISEIYVMDDSLDLTSDESAFKGFNFKVYHYTENRNEEKELGNWWYWGYGTDVCTITND